MKDRDNFWDNMATRYPRYDDDSMSKDVNTMLDFAKENGVDFKEANVLDIGCGTGTVAIPPC
ncbi:MAG: hypothetical protein PHE73_00070 [Sulfurovaceae bacterium]|nr:hypothetical protein [Sulfurovaceae bacterium]